MYIILLLLVKHSDGGESTHVSRTHALGDSSCESLLVTTRLDTFAALVLYGVGNAEHVDRSSHVVRACDWGNAPCVSLRPAMLRVFSFGVSSCAFEVCSLCAFGTKSTKHSP